ncbi:uncharacterized protein BJX67DRAFT_192506 [Aspergillus lucknowensis]|uniref:Uncharacterized protein n=1 Tax=Aspergillus lucknowensis TaxID=176173 RepID=A0ABR4LLP2_9EURO
MGEDVEETQRRSREVGLKKKKEMNETKKKLVQTEGKETRESLEVRLGNEAAPLPNQRHSPLVLPTRESLLQLNIQGLALLVHVNQRFHDLIHPPSALPPVSLRVKTLLPVLSRVCQTQCDGDLSMEPLGQDIPHLNKAHASLLLPTILFCLLILWPVATNSARQTKCYSSLRASPGSGDQTHGTQPTQPFDCLHASCVIR